MTKRLEGVFGPVVTPFKAGTEDLDVSGFRANLRAHMGDGLAGVLIAGSNGEAAMLSDEERVTLTVAARQEIPADRWLLVGTGAESARQCVARCRAAKEGGADAVLVVAPHYYSGVMTHEALAAHYARVADESPLPLILYNIPKYMHFALPADLVAELAKHQNVIGIKDSSGDLEMLKGFLRAQAPDFTVLTGSGSGMKAGLDAGARGGILAISLFAPARTLEVYQAQRAGDVARATAVQGKLVQAANVVVGKLGVAGVKWAMDHVGRVGGAPRVPLLPLNDAQRAEAAAALVGL